MSFTQIVAQARRVVRKTFGESARYEHPSAVGGVDLSVKWSGRLALQGNIGDDGYSDVITGVNRVFFNVEELNEKSLVLQKGGRLTLTDTLNQGTVLILDSMEPHKGPINEIWNVGVL